MSDKTIAIIGLGYVGLPLAVEFGKKYNTIGFDINQGRIDELKSGFDRTLEVDAVQLKEASLLSKVTILGVARILLLVLLDSAVTNPAQSPE